VKDKDGIVKTKGARFVGYTSYHRDSDYEKFKDHFKNVLLLRYRRINKFKKTIGRVLDIGASTGLLLGIFKERGWEAWGVEPSGTGELLSKRGIKLIKGTFEEAALPKSYFDVVVLNHTLEHLEDPHKVLEKVHSLLKKGGIVYVDVPNYGSLDSRLHGKSWKYLLPEEHRYHFTPDSLENVLVKSGFKIIWQKTSSGIFDVADPFTHFRLALAERPRAFIKDSLLAPLNVLTTLAGRGTSLAMMGQKK